MVPPEDVVAVSEYAYSPNTSNVLEWVGKLRPAIAVNAEIVLKAGPDIVFAEAGGAAGARGTRSSFHTPLSRTSTYPGKNRRPNLMSFALVPGLPVLSPTVAVAPVETVNDKTAR